MEIRNRVFVDSNFFVALFNPLDGLHQQAIDLDKKLDSLERQLMLSNFIFSEVVTVLSVRTGFATAAEAGESLLQNPAIEIIYIDHELNQQTWEIFKELRMKNLSFVDASTIAVMQAESLLELLTFDFKDFKPLARKYKFRLIS